MDQDAFFAPSKLFLTRNACNLFTDSCRSRSADDPTELYREGEDEDARRLVARENFD